MRWILMLTLLCTALPVHAAEKGEGRRSSRRESRSKDAEKEKEAAKPAAEPAVAAPAVAPPAEPQLESLDAMAPADPPLEPLAPAPPPPAPEKPAAAAPKPESAPAPSAPWRLAPHAAGGWTSEDLPGLSAPALRVGLTGGRTVGRSGQLSLAAGATHYRATYLTSDFLADGTLARTTLSEQHLEAAFGYSHVLDAGPYVQFEGGLGLRGDLLFNAREPQWFAGLAPQLAVRVRPDAAFALEASGGHLYNLLPFMLEAPTQAVLGRPVALSWFSLGVRWRPTGSLNTLGLGWTGEVLALEHSYRLYNFLSLGVSRAL